MRRFFAVSHRLSRHFKHIEWCLLRATDDLRRNCPWLISPSGQHVYLHLPGVDDGSSCSGGDWHWSIDEQSTPNVSQTAQSDVRLGVSGKQWRKAVSFFDITLYSPTDRLWLPCDALPPLHGLLQSIVATVPSKGRLLLPLQVPLSEKIVRQLSADLLRLSHHRFCLL